MSSHNHGIIYVPRYWPPAPPWATAAAAVGPGGGGGGSPTPKMLSSINNLNKQRNPKSEETPKTKIRLMFYNVFSLFYQKVKMILWSIRTFWYKGSAENKGNWQVRKKGYISQNSSPDSKADFSKQSILGVWSLILRRYVTTLNLYNLTLNIQYIKWHI